MNIAQTVPQLDADFFDERGLPKTYNLPPVQQIQQPRSMNILKKVQTWSNAIHISEDGVEIQNNISTSVSDSVPGSVPPPDFPPVEFPSMEYYSQSQMNCSSISDTLHLRETGNSLKEGSNNSDFHLNSTEKPASLKEMGETRDLNVSTRPTQFQRDCSDPIISKNSILGKTVSGTKNDSSTALPIEIETSFDTEREIQ